MFICAQSVSEFLWDRLRASIEFTDIPERAQYARFGGTVCTRGEGMVILCNPRDPPATDKPRMDGFDWLIGDSDWDPRMQE
eukprot:COSAG02_NODE_1757_length_11046_cov_9.787613_6_plen_81_part_00